LLPIHSFTTTTQGFSVLAGLPSLSLKVEGVELGEIPVDEIGTSHVHLLKALGPSLTSLQYHFSTVGAEEEFRAFLELAKEGHLQKVTSIKFVCRPVIEGVSEEQVATLARSCPLLQVGNCVSHVACLLGSLSCPAFVKQQANCFQTGANSCSEGSDGHAMSVGVDTTLSRVWE
jgi:hypothetical protein